MTKNAVAKTWAFTQSGETSYTSDNLDSSSSPPTYLQDMNFDGFSTGVAPTGVNGFDIAVNSGSTTSLVSDTRSVSGANSAAFTIAQSTEPWGAENVYDIGPSGGDSTLVEGYTLWIQFKVFHPTGWDNDTSGDGGTKFFRFRTETTGEVPLSVSTFQLRGASTITGLRTEREGDTPVDVDITQAQFGGFALNQWNTFEFQFVASETVGILRAWCNHLPCGEITGLNTIGTLSNTRYLRQMLLNFWNNGSPATQTLYIDDFRIASSLVDTPNSTDSAGNTYIGDV